MFSLVEQGGDLAKTRAELIGNVAPGMSGSLAIGLDEDCRTAAETTLCWLFGTWANSDLMK
jgi:hypothetical protein